jgi:hypothetical protein
MGVTVNEEHIETILIDFDAVLLTRVKVREATIPLPLNIVVPDPAQDVLG